MISAIEHSPATGVTGTQLIEKAATTPIVIFVEVLTLIPIFGVSTWVLMEKQRTPSATGVALLLLSGLMLFGPISDIIDYPKIAAIEILAAGIFSILAYWFSLRRLQVISNRAVDRTRE
jgi:hypothetical protein